MIRYRFAVSKLLSGSLLSGLAVGISVLFPLRASTQPLPACPPPATQEYLLLVRGKDAAARNEIAAILPEESSVLVCQYLGEPVVRAGRFNSLESANAWATYMTTVAEYESFVLRPANSQVVERAGTLESGLYQPRRLSPGYAVLVEYGSDPEVAISIGQITRPVGLAVYQQRHYLLAAHTSDAAEAAGVLQRLSNAQQPALLVDAEAVVQLSATVSVF
ncbi:MAG: hypothetical protein AAF703_01895 [Cyanobacteria bacterium P01_D01_bin.105]